METLQVQGRGLRSSFPESACRCLSSSNLGNCCWASSQAWLTNSNNDLRSMLTRADKAARAHQERAAELALKNDELKAEIERIRSGVDTASDAGAGTSVDISGTVLMLSNRGEHNCAVVYVNGFPSIQCWGQNNHGQLGISPGGSSPDPLEVDVPGSIISDLAAGEDHTCVITGGDVYCWGYNE